MTPRARRVIGLAGALPSMVAAALCLVQPEILERLDSGVYDRLVRAAGTQPPSGRVVIVDVDERSLASVGQWPWPRTRVAELIDRLRDLGAATVALDIMFAEPDRTSEGVASADESLARSLRDGQVVLGYALTFDQALERSPDCLRHPLSLAVITPQHADSSPPFFRATRAICNLELLSAAAPSSGFLNAAPDADGILRRVPLLIEFNDRIYPGLALAAVSAAADVHGDTLRVANVNTASLAMSRRTENAAPAMRPVPLDGGSHLLVRYRGPKRTFPYLAAVDVLEDKVAADLVKDKIVFLGTTALGTREVVATPLDTLFTGVEVQATVADNLLQQDFFTRPEHSVAVETLATILLGLLATLVARHRGVAWGIGSTAVLMLSAWTGAALLMAHTGNVVSPLYPMLGLGGAMAGLTVAGLSVERRRADAAGVDRAASQRLMVQSLLSLVEARDAATGQHSRRTQQYTRILAQALSTHPSFSAYLSPERIDLLATLAPLHDIGKVGIADVVLHKPGPLSTDELAEMRKHPGYGRDVIVNAERAAGVRDDETMAVAKDIVYTHHERWDGSGYPEGLHGADIPIPGRLIALVDVYDAMRSARPYHRAMTHEEVLQIVIKGRGTHFDPTVVDAFVTVSPLLKMLSERAA